MRIISRKCWLTLITLLLFVPGAFATISAPRYDHEKQTKCFAVPEGGSGLGYAALIGLTFLGAIVVRSRSAMQKQS